MNPLADLLDRPPRVVNVGVEDFAAPLRSGGFEVVSLDWRPPAQADARLGRKLARLVADPAVERANQEATERMLAVRALLVDVQPAAAVLPELKGERLLLHAGPPIGWERMCGPMRAAVVGAALLEGWAATPDAAERLAESGGIGFSPCHDHGAVGPMAGIISASMPLLVVEDATTKRRAYSNLNEGQGRCLRYGALGPDVLDRLRWMEERLGPSLGAALRDLQEPVDLSSITAQALQMGDECHSRNVASSALLVRQLAPGLARHAESGGIEALDFLQTNNYWFLNFSMAASKLAADAGRGISYSTVVTALSRNGVDFGVRVSGTGDRWFCAPAPVPVGLYFAGYGAGDANPDIGDSSITETTGLGGFALAAAPAIVGFVGGNAAQALTVTKEMEMITVTHHHVYQLPALNFIGTPFGIDVRAVLDTGLEPTLTTGISHREQGIGQIGAGLTQAPMACFAAALDAVEVPPGEAAELA
jgi:hypothetical protein